ncbi:MAG: YdhR family protein [Anaerolineae bacterium]|nr:YdhR family protein [Anaerolineae bacterium]
MTARTASPLGVVARSAALMLGGRTIYPRERVGQTITLDDGRQYRIFREVIMRDNPPREGGGVFRVWFQTKMSVPHTMTFSLLTRIGFVGMPGFRGKLWLVDEATETFGGIYQFDSVEDARRYQESFAMRFSEWRSRPGCFATEVYARTSETVLYRAQQQPIPPLDATARQYSRG